VPDDGGYSPPPEGEKYYGEEPPPNGYGEYEGDFSPPPEGDYTESPPEGEEPPPEGGEGGTGSVIYGGGITGNAFLDYYFFRR